MKRFVGAVRSALLFLTASLCLLLPGENTAFSVKSTDYIPSAVPRQADATSVLSAGQCGLRALEVSQKPQVVYKKHENSGKKIALTFDDGPHPIYTPVILDILDRYKVKATFFVIGENALYYPDVVARIANEGHEIGNHTHYHRHLTDISPAQIRRDIALCEKTIYEICEYRTKLFRPPEGFMSDAICRLAQKDDYAVILWSIDTHDWSHKPAGQIYEGVKKRISSGDIILMHDYIAKSTTPDALRLIIPYLLEEGYQFVTVSELIGSK